MKSNALNDETVTRAILAVQNGDENAFSVVVEAYQKKLRNAIAYRCPQSLDADEIAHLAFIEAYKRIRKFEAGTEFYVWLWVIARYVLLGQIKKAKRTLRNRENYMNRMLLEQAGTQIFEADEEDGAHVDALRSCLAQLPESARNLLRNRYEHKVTLNAVAKLLGRTANALRVQLFHIREGLRQCVTQKLAMES